MSKYITYNKTYNADEFTNLVFDNIVYAYGTPKGIVSNRGTVFISAF